ncbi:Deubiquitinase DESI2 (Desumoylating isopeptidase 2) (DeSI-2) (PPPDE peptidase domain-containing protein 1) (Protein FAM152A) [Durusdinium trenchii]|uniref:Deubiquitinase DESI2 (Desumoylating isopeptidase 2) (DeSI-2) (PPPDE peptidase domain-containing protein 1) (Protein FAM152A) n=1 Tax=Durusdinium trenchii TaxID=1381693 RepID=A0ABP0K9E5_9DINO
MTEALPRSGSFVEDHFQDASCLRQASHCFKEVYIAHPAEVFSGSQVLLHVYELFEFVRVNKILASELLPLGGALHAGVEVYGREWSYGGSSGSGTGIVCEVPRTNRKHRYRESIPLGYTRLTKAEVALVLGDLVEVWRGEDYHWLNNNCLSFANAFCRKLGVGGIPAWIDRLPRGVSAVKQGMQCVAERVRDLADGTLEVVHVLGSIACIKRLKLGPFQHCQIVCLSFLTASLHEMLKTCEAIVEGWID